MVNFEGKNGYDMSPAEFKKFGYELIDWIARYIENIENYPVLSQAEPGEIKNRIPSSPPEKGQNFGEIIKDVEKIILPGITHWNHPKFMAYFNSTSSGPGILGELLSAAFNVNGMIWQTSPAATELEHVVLGWLRQMMNLPEDFWGIIYDTASISTLHAIAAAKTAAEDKYGKDYELSKLCVYFSDHAHSSVEKAARFIGVKNIRKIPVDENFKMIPAELAKKIEADSTENLIPFCVIATVGTTSTTSIDPVDEIAEICMTKDIWLHVDAAYGGTAAIVPEMRHILNGCEYADSIVVNPHKWLFTPIDLSAFYIKKPDLLKKTFSLVHEYLKTEKDNAVINYMDYGIQLGRRFRSLKLWFIIRYFGKEGLINIIRENIRISREFAELIEEHPDFEKTAPNPFALVCFRAKANGLSENELNKLNEELLRRINSTGKSFLSHTKLNGKYVLRLAINGIHTGERHMLETWELIKRIFEQLKNEFGSKGNDK